MMNSLQQPEITITTMDYDRLCNLAEHAVRDMPEVATFLLEELDRANIALRPPPENPTVRMGSYVYYRDAANEAVHRVRLVYPEDSDPRRNHVSILAPIGAALIGLSAGQTIRWYDRHGRQKALTVLAVLDEPDTLAHESLSTR
jgi:regulator of nucleoside diphosphate kinase